MKDYKHEAHEDRELIKDLKAKKPAKAKKKAKKVGKIERVLHEFKEKTLRSGSKKGPKVTDRKQALAIAIAESKKAKKKK